jgi:hypothetical protein
LSTSESLDFGADLFSEADAAISSSLVAEDEAVSEDPRVK